jgi:predicted lipoprotein with Yx(FWY)xxD motif
MRNAGSQGTTTRASSARLHIVAAALVLMTLAVVAVLASRAMASSSAKRSGATVSLRKTTLGQVLVDGRGRTLYLFAKDKNGISACAGKCASFWPPDVTSGKPQAGHGVNSALLGTTKRSDGRLQVTYNKHPLYTFSLDKKPGNTKGEELSAFGAKWYAVSSKGAKVLKSGGGGYGP